MAAAVPSSQAVSDEGDAQSAQPSAGEAVVYLLECANALERRVLDRWVEKSGSASIVDTVAIPSPRTGPKATAGDDLDAAVTGEDATLMAPLRVAWMPRDEGRRSGGTWQFLLSLLFGDPYDPGFLRRHWIARFRPERCQVIEGEPATLGALRERWRSVEGLSPGEATGLSEFVRRQATLALERGERRIRGMRYKVPRFVGDSILARPAFRGGLRRLARELGRSEGEAVEEARANLGEIAADHRPYWIDLVAEFTRRLYRQGYDAKLDYDSAELERIYALAQRHPVVFLPSHKSNLDHLVLLDVLHRHGHPPNHTAGGINMNFFPLGPLMRRSGVFFIRRTFKDAHVYKYVLGHYLDYLIEKRFPLEWYIEGGRSRSGKLLPPRYGLLGYVVDAYRRAKSEDVYLLPVSIAYDQIQDVGSYTSEQRGGKKEAEGFGWLLRVVSELKRRYGGIHLRFGEPLSLKETIGANDPGARPKPDEVSLDLQKLAFEVSARINRVTPITPTSLVTMALLGAGGRALTQDQVTQSVDLYLGYAGRMKFPLSEPVSAGDSEEVLGALGGLIENGVVERFTDGTEPIYAIAEAQHLTAAYYRNTIIHFFLNRAIVESALVRAAEPGIEDAEGEFWAETLRLRDLMKFEFFFSEKEAYEAELRSELDEMAADWRERLARGAEGARDLVNTLDLHTAHLILRPFLEAYRVVGDALERYDAREPVDRPAMLADCLGLGRQYCLQRHIQNEESVSKVLFESALKLASNRDLLARTDEPVAADRAAFAREIRRAIRRVDLVGAIADANRAGIWN